MTRKITLQSEIILEYSEGKIKLHLNENEILEMTPTTAAAIGVGIDQALDVITQRAQDHLGTCASCQEEQTFEEIIKDFGKAPEFPSDEIRSRAAHPAGKQFLNMEDLKNAPKRLALTNDNKPTSYNSLKIEYKLSRTLKMVGDLGIDEWAQNTYGPFRWKE